MHRSANAAPKKAGAGPGADDASANDPPVKGDDAETSRKRKRLGKMSFVDDVKERQLT